MAGGHARLDAHASANGGHGNDRPTQCLAVTRHLEVASLSLPIRQPLTAIR